MDMFALLRALIWNSNISYIPGTVPDISFLRIVSLSYFQFSTRKFKVYLSERASDALFTRTFVFCEEYMVYQDTGYNKYLSKSLNNSKCVTLQQTLVKSYKDKLSKWHRISASTTKKARTAFHQRRRPTK